MSLAEPNWIEVSVGGSDYDQEMDVNAEPGSLRAHRYRERSFTGYPVDSWKYGTPPATVRGSNATTDG